MEQETDGGPEVDAARGQAAEDSKNPTEDSKAPRKKPSKDEKADAGKQGPQDKKDAGKPSKAAEDAGEQGPGDEKDGGRPLEDLEDAGADDRASEDPVDDGLRPRCDAEAVLEARCRTCHGTERMFGAPMSLVSYADFQGKAPITKSVDLLELIGRRIHDEQTPMPPSGDLTEEELATLDLWLAEGAPSDEGTGCEDEMQDPAPMDAGVVDESDAGMDEPEEPAEPDGPAWPPKDADECYIITAHGEGGLDTPFVVPGGSEIHPQQYFDAPWGDEPVQAVGFKAITDNATILHHWIIYENTGSEGAFLEGWAPGNESLALPSDVGMYLPSGPNSLRLDLHYYNRGSDEDQEDRSGVEICVAKANPRPITASVFGGFSNIYTLLVPRQTRSEVTDYCVIEAAEPVHVVGVGPHMHEMGVRAKLEVKRAGSEDIEVWHDRGYSFDDQKVYPLTGKVLEAGDVVKTTCTYENTSNVDIRYGEDTGNEMCFNWVTYYPMDGIRCAGGFRSDLLGDPDQTW